MYNNCSYDKITPLLIYCQTRNKIERYKNIAVYTVIIINSNDPRGITQFIFANFASWFARTAMWPLVDLWPMNYALCSFKGGELLRWSPSGQREMNKIPEDVHVLKIADSAIVFSRWYMICNISRKCFLVIRLDIFGRQTGIYASIKDLREERMF